MMTSFVVFIVIGTKSKTVKKLTMMPIMETNDDAWKQTNKPLEQDMPMPTFEHYRDNHHHHIDYDQH
ncbi:hypothetical protein DERP_014148 [Dermatophagoides pteronyssinus]|uniref:Uncharacterized protein n=1 Tax=Dermatophagoides pteronyssinus TaxID=6956 RepID=A0ABQ8IXI9_DERPT|nr:hypothetical protein DERP_014148 [Dermatophagoides pteronyssinus]